MIKYSNLFEIIEINHMVKRGWNPIPFFDNFMTTPIGWYRRVFFSKIPISSEPTTEKQNKDARSVNNPKLWRARRIRLSTHLARKEQLDEPKATRTSRPDLKRVSVFPVDLSNLWSYITIITRIIDKMPPIRLLPGNFGGWSFPQLTIFTYNVSRFLGVVSRLPFVQLSLN